MVKRTGQPRIRSLEPTYEGLKHLVHDVYSATTPRFGAYL